MFYYIIHFTGSWSEGLNVYFDYYTRPNYRARVGNEFPLHRKEGVRKRRWITFAVG